MDSKTIIVYGKEYEVKCTKAGDKIVGRLFFNGEPFVSPAGVLELSMSDAARDDIVEINGRRVDPYKYLVGMFVDHIKGTLEYRAMM